MKIACISLGCPKNQVDLDVMVHILLSAGHETVADLAFLSTHSGQAYR